MTDPLAAKAAQLLRTGQDEAAIAAYLQLLANAPSSPDAWFNLGYLQRKTGRYDDALRSYQAALDHGVRCPEEVHVNRAAIFSEYLNRSDLAVGELEAALVLRPGYVHALFNLATIHEDLGDLTTARLRYREALVAAPDNAAALARLAMLDIHAGDPTGAIADLTHALDSRQWHAEDAAELQFARARALDAAGQHAAAFEALTFANMVSCQSARASGFAYDRKRQEALVDALIETFPLEQQAAGEAGDAPIFICGLFRSGSTLVEQILAAHRDVINGGELEILPALIRDRIVSYPSGLRGASIADLNDLRERYLAEKSKLFSDLRRITDKRPDNYLHIGLIKSIFPNAKIVHTHRNVADNLLSIYFLNFQYAVSYGFDLGDIAHWIGQYRRLMAHWKSIYRGDIIDMSYDDLVSAPESVIAHLLQACGLSWDANCLAPERVQNVVRTASVLQVREALHRRASGRAAAYAPFLAAALRQLG